MKWIDRSDGGPHEAGFLKLDCSLIKTRLGWKPRWNLERAVSETVAWTRGWIAGAQASGLMDGQIKAFLAERRGGI